MEQSRQVSKPAIHIIGVETRTTNQDETSISTAKIPALWARFDQIRADVPNKVEPARFLALYSEYESDANGAYSETIGFEVASLEHIPEGMVAKTIPPSIYAVFTTPYGPIPGIIIAAWQGIWSLHPSQMGGNRSYTGDFELYDQRSYNPQNAQIDIYIAIK